MAQRVCTGNSLSKSTPRSETVMLVVDQVISVLLLLALVITCAFRCLLHWSVQLPSYACVLLNWCCVGHLQLFRFLEFGYSGGPVGKMFE